MPKLDNMEIEILEDGTIKCVTDPISGANHSNAEQFLKYVAQLAGGETTRKKRFDVNHSLRGALQEHAADGHTHDGDVDHEH